MYITLKASKTNITQGATTALCYQDGKLEHLMDYALNNCHKHSIPEQGNKGSSTVNTAASVRFWSVPIACKKQQNSLILMYEDEMNA